MQPTHRRNFLKTSAVAAGTSLFGIPTISLGNTSANERIRVAICGTGGRGQAHLKALHNRASDNVEIAALCDCDREKLEKTAKTYQEMSNRQVPLYDDLRRLFDDKSIDAISFATPNHWHALGVIWACQSGKDVYVEKPGSHTFREGQKMVESARKYDCVCQHGTQNRSSPNIVEGISKLKQGIIGRVYMARAITYKLRGDLGRRKPKSSPEGLDWDLWQGPAPARAYSKFDHNRWHWIWDYGNGDIGNQGVHQLDLIRWGLDLNRHPTTVQSVGGNYVHDDDAETPLLQTASWQWQGRDLLVTLEARNWYTNSEAGFRDEYPFVQTEFPVGTIFLGTEGYMIMPDYSSYYTFLGRGREPGPSASEVGHPIKDQEHFDNWISAVRNRTTEDLNAEITEGHYSSAMCHLANIAYRVGRTLHFNHDSESFSNDSVANELLRRPPREPYAVPKEV